MSCHRHHHRHHRHRDPSTREPIIISKKKNWNTTQRTSVEGEDTSSILEAKYKICTLDIEQMARGEDPRKLYQRATFDDTLTPTGVAVSAGAGDLEAHQYPLRGREGERDALTRFLQTTARKGSTIKRSSNTPVSSCLYSQLRIFGQEREGKH